MFLFYPSVCLNTFRLLRSCQKVCLDLEEQVCQYYLDTDLSIECSGSKYDFYRTMAIIVAVCISGGLPASLLWLLYSKYRYVELDSLKDYRMEHETQ